MTREPMGRRRIKIEIPLPDGPMLRKLSFSLKSLAVLVAMIAIGLAIFNHATESERSKHLGGSFSFVISGTTGGVSGSVSRNQLPDIRSFISSKRNQIEHWPPKIWIKRADLGAPELEERIDITCGGASENPTFQPELELQPGDVVFIDAGRMKTSADALRDVANSLGVILKAPRPESTIRKSEE